MQEEQKGVEATVGIAPAQQEGTGTNGVPAEDPEAKLKALIEENANLTRDRDNYRNATLALKGKKEVEDLDLTDPVQAQAFIQKSIEDRLLQEKQIGSETKIAEYATELARKNKELNIALASKATVSGLAAGGSGADNKASQVTYFSLEQAEALKTRWKSQGFEEAKFPEMLKQAEESAKRVSAGLGAV